MTEYNNDNTGAVWKNTRRKTEKHPHFTGSITVDGVDYWCSMWWNKERTEKQPVFSMSVTPKEKKPEDSKGNEHQEFLEDDIPF